MNGMFSERYYMKKGENKKLVEDTDAIKGTNRVKRGFMDVTTVEQAYIAQDAGSVAVMVLDKLPIDVRRAGGVARPASIPIICDILDAITIPVMAKCRLGHTYESSNGKMSSWSYL